MTDCVLWFILKVPWVGLQCVIVAFPDFTYILCVLHQDQRIPLHQNDFHSLLHSNAQGPTYIFRHITTFQVVDCQTS